MKKNAHLHYQNKKLGGTFHLFLIKNSIICARIFAECHEQFFRDHFSVTRVMSLCSRVFEFPFCCTNIFCLTCDVMLTKFVRCTCIFFGLQKFYIPSVIVLHSLFKSSKFKQSYNTNCQLLTYIPSNQSLVLDRPFKMEHTAHRVTN